jgi:hypothetical protein
MVDSKYVVEYNGKPYVALNERLIKRQGLTEAEVDDIKRLHEYRLSIEDRMRKAIGWELKSLYSIWVETQYNLQEKWKFPKSENHIRFWEAPKCTCPRMDNEDSYPHGFYIKNTSCPIHGE